MCCRNSRIFKFEREHSESSSGKLNRRDFAMSNVTLPAAVAVKLG